ncbi:Global transcription regulator sge1 [Lecanicillium sp. MT-2017a]|nr:Global transcription regulator sge1 [Lecanicillium sp. MT-2017a]
MESHTSPLEPTFRGHVSTTLDALILFEACLTGILSHVPRRPHDRERQDLIKSGHVFIYEEHASGIKRWTDGVSWSPSRILGNFLIYRELEKPFPPGEKKRALKKAKKSPQGISKAEPAVRPNLSYAAASLDSSSSSANRDHERSLIGSLVDSYPFKPDGLVKKTISITFNGVPHHLVSYYNVDDVTNGRLPLPPQDMRLADIVPRPELFLSQNFRTPVDEVEYATLSDERDALVASYNSGQMPPHGSSGPVLQRAFRYGNLQHAMDTQYGQQRDGLHATDQHYHQHHQGQQPSPTMYAYNQHPAHGYAVHPGSFTAPGMQSHPYMATMQTGNYSLNPTRTASVSTSGASMGQDYPRQLPTHTPPRRHSHFDAAAAAAAAADMSHMSFSSTPEARPMAAGNPYLNPQQSYFMAQQHQQQRQSLSGQTTSLFPSMNGRMKVESDGLAGDDALTQSIGLEDPGVWQFDSLDGNDDQQYMNGSWGTPGPNSVQRG